MTIWTKHDIRQNIQIIKFKKQNAKKKKR